MASSAKKAVVPPAQFCRPQQARTQPMAATPYSNMSSTWHTDTYIRTLTKPLRVYLQMAISLQFNRLRSNAASVVAVICRLSTRCCFNYTAVCCWCIIGGRCRPHVASLMPCQGCAWLTQANTHCHLILILLPLPFPAQTLSHLLTYTTTHTCTHTHTHTLKRIPNCAYLLSASYPTLPSLIYALRCTLHFGNYISFRNQHICLG